MSTINNRRKFGPQRSGMTHEAWRKAQGVWRKSVAHWLTPKEVAAQYGAGKNKTKRMRRELMVSMSGSVRAFRRQQSIERERAAFASA